MVDSHGEQVSGFGVTTVLRISRVRWTKFLIPSVYVEYTINTNCRKSKDNENDLKAHKKTQGSYRIRKNDKNPTQGPVEKVKSWFKALAKSKGTAFISKATC